MSVQPPACPLCRGTTCEPVHSAVPDFEHGLPKLSDFFTCRTCGLLFQWPQPSLADLESYYPSDYRPHVSSSGLLGFLKGIQSRMLARKYSRWLPRDRGARVLDLGCGSGGFLTALRSLGYRELTGIDRNPALAAVFEGTPITYRSLQIEPELRLEGTFDAIVLNNVLEHFLDPRRVLETCRAALRPGGRVLLLTPNADSWSHRVFGRYWSGLHAPRHPRVFVPGALRRLASEAGFKSVDIRYPSDPPTWAFSFQNWTRRSGAGVARGTAWYSLAGLPAWMPAAMAERWAGRSSSMVAALG